MESLLQKLHGKTATVGVLGLGYVGLPLAVEFGRAGYRVIGFDLDQAKVDRVNQGDSYISDVEGSFLGALVASGRLRATTDLSQIAQVDAISICVPTPLRKTKDPDISYVKQSAEQVASYLRNDTLVVLESTTYPGTTDELVAPILAGSDRVIGRDIFLAFSPERVDPGNPRYHTQNTPKVVGGITPRCTEMALALYSQVIGQVVAVGTAREAEMVKLLENTFRAVNIALVNELLLMCDRMGIDIWKVVDAAATKPFGFMPFYPGPGIGGHCIPIDPMYLSWKAKTYDFFNRFIELATDINGNMPRFVVTKLMRILNDRRQPLNGARILVLGVAYKPDVTDVRESPGLEILKLLVQHGAVTSYHDPHVPSLALGSENLLSEELTEQNIRSKDCILVATNHTAIDWALVARHARLVFDTRNALSRFEGPDIVRL
ncbi:MAG: nucleotide sugar dehydrogenase [Bradymonadales bacterium]|nr:nucleotide sugar dehydrogenase [Bradymonadales bacterium]